MAVAVAYGLPADPGPTRSLPIPSAALLAEAGVPVPSLADWPAATALLDEFLSESRVIRDSEASVRIAGAAEALAEEDPVAALLPAAVVVAEWEGGSADWLFSTRRGAVNWGWHGLVLPLARIMARMPMLWSARQLVEDASRGMWLVRARDPGELDWHTVEALSGFRDLRISSRRATWSPGTGWPGTSSEPPARGCAIRGPLAALWWTLGDPWHAHGVAGTGFTPTLNQVRRLVDRVLRRTSTDPMLAAVADRLWRGPCLDAAGQQSVRRRMGWYLTLSRPFAQLEALIDELGVSPSNAYSRAVTSFFSGGSSRAERATISELMPHLVGIAARFAPSSACRIGVSGAAQPGITREARQPGHSGLLDRKQCPIRWCRRGGSGRCRGCRAGRLAEGNPRAAGAEHARLARAEPPATDGIRGELAPLAPGYVAAGAFRASRAADLALAFGTGPPDLPAMPEDQTRPGQMQAGQMQAGPGNDPGQALRLAEAETIMTEGDRQRQAHEYQVAVAAYETVLECFGTDPDPAIRAVAAEALMGKGLVLGELGQPAAEMQAYDEAAGRYGGDSDQAVRVWVSKALFNKSVVLRQLGRLDAALAAYDDVVARFGQDPDPEVHQVAAKALVRKGDVLRELGRPADAVAAYDEVAARFADSAYPAIVELVRTARDMRHRTQTGE